MRPGAYGTCHTRCRLRGIGLRSMDLPLSFSSTSCVLPCPQTSIGWHTRPAQFQSRSKCTRGRTGHDPADAIVPTLVHRERGRPRRIEPPHMRLEVLVDARATRGRLVRLFVAERPQDHTGVIAVAADDPLEFRDSLWTRTVDPLLDD